MNEPRPPASDDPDQHWFEVVGGMPAAAGEADDAIALRQVLGCLLEAPEPAPATGVASSLPLLLKRLDELIADEDLAWFEAIGGGEASENESEGAREGRQLRSALLRPEAPTAAVAGSEAELLKRIAALTPAPRAAPAPASGWQRWVQWLLGSGHGNNARGLALAGVMALAIGVGVVWQGRTDPDSELERGTLGTPRTTPGGSPVFEVGNPEQAARSFAQALGRAGVTAVVVPEAEFWNVRAGLPEPLGDAAKQVLQRNRIPVPADRRLEVVFVEKR